MSPNRQPVAVVVGATSKWQADGRNTKLAHGKALDDRDLPVGVRWGVGGAIAQKFAKEGFFVVLTTRKAANAAGLDQAIREQGGASTIVEMDLVSDASISKAFATIREKAGDPEVLVYNAGYLEGRDLPPDKELLEHVPLEILETAQHIAIRGPFLVAKEVLPAMRKHGVHVANVVIDGLIDSPGTRALPRAQKQPELVMNPVKIAEAFYYLHTQDRSCWTHELQLTPFVTKPSF